jgi:hypothetical protein
MILGQKKRCNPQWHCVVASSFEVAALCRAKRWATKSASATTASPSRTSKAAPRSTSRITTRVDHYASVLLFTGPFRLPEPADRYLENARGRVDWDALKSPEQAAASVSPQDRRAWLGKDERAAMEEIEACWKAEAQSLKPSPPHDITRDVPALPAGRRMRKPH